MASYGKYNYESVESRALKSINADSYNKDLAKNIIQLNHNSEYMAQYLRKLQKGVDEANQNAIEQVQSLVSDVLVLFAGGSNTQLEFGDLKYIFQAIGSLFGFTNPDGSVKLPPNLFEAAWHFFSTYIVPVGDFDQVINLLIDNALAFILDIFGEVPILGEAAQQLAVWITDLRDMLISLNDALDAILGAINLDISDLSGITDTFEKIFDFLRLGNVFDPDFSISSWAVDFITNILLPTELFGGANWGELYQNLTGTPSSGNALADLGNFLKSSLFGAIDPNRISSVSFSAISDSPQNLLDNPSFTTSGSMDEVPNIEHDGADGHASLGCAKFIANGTELAFVSNWIPMTPSQKIKASAWVKWEGVTLAGGSPGAFLDVRAYNGKTFISSHHLTGHNLSAGSSSNPGENDFFQMAEYEYAPPAGTTRVLIQPKVTDNVLSGTVKFDDGLVYMSNPIPQSFIQGLIGDLADKLGLSAWNTWLTNTFGNMDTLVNQLLGILSGDAVTPINSVIQDIKDWWNGLGNKVQNLTSGGLFDASKLSNLDNIGDIPAQVVKSAVDTGNSIDDAIQKLIDSAVEGAGNLIGNGFGFNDMIAQIAGLRQATSGANSAVVNLEAQVANLNPAASSEVVNFNEFNNAAAPPSMFTKIDDIGSGSLTTQDGNLQWSGSSSGREFYLFNGGTLQSDLFEVKFVLPQVPSHGWFGDDSSNFLYLIGRSDAAGNNMVMARVGWDEIRFYSYNSGVFTQIGPGVARSDIVTGGCSVSFKGGTVVEPRYFEARVNGEKVFDIVDEAPVSLYGANYRLCGLGVEKGSSYNTGKISTWSMMDGGASAGSGIVSGWTVSGPTNLGIWRGTRAAYDAITSKNPNWIYVVRD